MTCSRRIDRLLQASCLGLVGALAIAGCGGSENNPKTDAATIEGGASTDGPASIVVDKTALNFGSVDLGKSSSMPQVVTVIHRGGSTTITPTLIGAGFAIDSQTCGALAPSGTCTIAISFTPTAIGPATGTLTVVGLVKVSLSGTGAPTGTFSVSDRVDLGKILVNQPKAGSSVITTTDAVPGLVCLVTGTDFAPDATTTTCPAPVATAAGSCAVGFTLTSATAGMKAGTVTCTAGGVTKNTAISAEVVTPASLVVTPEKTAFQTPTGTTSAAVTFAVANLGGSPTGQVSVAIAGVNADQFEISSPGCLAPLQPAGNCLVQVVFKPTTDGQKLASLTITDSAAPAAPLAAALTGTATGVSNLAITGTPALGTVVVGATGTPGAFTVKNNGGTASGALTVAISETEFVKSDDTCTGVSLPAAGTCTLAIALKPTSVGAKTAILTVSGASGSPGSLQLSGAAIGGAGLTVSPPSLDFGSIPVNTITTEMTIQVTNGGGAPTGVLTFAKTGAGATQFNITGNNCQAALVPTGKCSIVVRFEPTIVGNAAATVTISDGIVSGKTEMTGTATPAAMLTITPATTCAQNADPFRQHTTMDLPGGCGVGATFMDTVIGQTNGAYPKSTPGSGVLFTITNNAVSTTETGALTVATSGDAKDDFIVKTNTCTASLPAGASCTVLVDFKPAKEGARAAVLQVSTVKGGNAGANLNGKGLPFIEIVPCGLVGSNSSNCAALAAGETGLDFGQAPLGVQLATKKRWYEVIVRGSTAANFTNQLTLALTSSATPADFRVETGFDYYCQNFVADVSTAQKICWVYLDFYPQSSKGDKTGTVTISGASGGTATIKVNGTVSGPLTIEPSPALFGSVSVGSSSSSVTLTVTNQGTQPQGPLSVAIDGANAAEFALTLDQCSGVTLAPSTNCKLAYVLIPTSAGAKTATLTVTAGGETSTDTLTGTGTSEVTIVATPETHDFGKVPLAAAGEWFAVTITNPATTETGNIMFGLTGTCTPGFVCDGFELAQGTNRGTCGDFDTVHLGGGNPATCTIKLRFAPTNPGSGSTLLPSFAGKREAQMWVVDGRTWTYQYVDLKAEATSQVTLSADTHDFGNVPAGGASDSFTFTMKNMGASAAVPNVLVEAPFVSLSGTTCGTSVTSLGADSTCLVVVGIGTAPLTLGPVLNSSSPPAPFTLTVHSGNARAIATLKATVVNPAKLEVVGVSNVTGIGFANIVNLGAVRQGESTADVTVYYQNTGDVATKPIHYLWGGSVNDTAHAEFAFASDQGASGCIGNGGLAPKTICSVKLHLTPTSAGAKSATFEIKADNVVSAVDAFTFMGTGLATSGVVYVTAPFVAFPATAVAATGPVATSATVGFYLYNGTTSAIDPSSLAVAGEFQLDAAYGGATSCSTAATSLGAGSNCTFGVKFAPAVGSAPPTGAVYRFGTVTLNTSTVKAGLVGQAQKPATIQITNPTAGNAFGTVVRGVTSAPKTFKITNMGDVASAALTMSIGGTAAGSELGLFQAGTECNKVLAAGESCDVTVTVTPAIASAVPTSGSVLLQAKVGATVLGASSAMTVIGVDPASLSVAPSTAVTAADEAMGLVAGLQYTNITIANGNPAVPTEKSGVLSVTLSNAKDYRLDPNTCANAMDPVLKTGLAGGTTCVVRVAFKPDVKSAPGTLSTTLTVTGAPGGTKTLAFSGKGIAALSFVTANGGSTAATTTAFASVAAGAAVGDQPTKTIWVKNAGNVSPTGLLSTVLTGADFRIIEDLCVGETLGSPGWCSVTVRFEPKIAGAKTGSLVVSGTPGNSATMALSGTAN